MLGRRVVKYNHIEFFLSKLSVSYSRYSGGLLATAFNSNMTREFSHTKSHSLHSLAKRALSGDYIAGLVQADGSFSAVLCRKLRGDKEYFHLSLVFTLVLPSSPENVLILRALKDKFGDRGNIILSRKNNNTIKYQVKNNNDLLNIIIPFFHLYPLRGNGNNINNNNIVNNYALENFLRFKFILEVLSKNTHLYRDNINLFLALMVIAGNINNKAKLGTKIRFLKPEQAKYVVNNIIPDGVDISSLNNSLSNFKPSPLSSDFIKGLLETSVNNLRKVSEKDRKEIIDNFLAKSLGVGEFKRSSLSEGSCGKVVVTKDVAGCEGFKRSHSAASKVAGVKSFKSLPFGGSAAWAAAHCPVGTRKRMFSSSICREENILTLDGTKGKVTSVRNFQEEVEAKVKAERIYENAEVDKLKILKENKGKCGIYL